MIYDLIAIEADRQGTTLPNWPESRYEGGLAEKRHIGESARMKPHTFKTLLALSFTMARSLVKIRHNRRKAVLDQEGVTGKQGCKDAAAGVKAKLRQSGVMVIEGAALPE